MSFILGFINWLQWIATTFGYPGAFLASFVGSASIIFPIPSFFLVLVGGASLNPWLVAIVSAAGASLGEITGYILGVGGKKLAEKKNSKWLKKSEKWSEKYGLFWIIFIFAALPLPDDVVGIIAGFVKYSYKKFLLASFLGKLILYIALAFAGLYGIESIIGFLG